MFRIHRQNTRTTFPRCLHEDVTGNDQGFFVGQKYFFPCPGGQYGRRQTCRAYNCCHDDIHVRKRGDFSQSFGSAEDPGLAACCCQGCG
ncbi:hypothetical protein D3C83_70780 [compost metagenome]